LIATIVSDSLSRLEVSKLARAAFDRLGVSTVAQLCARTQRELLEATYTCASDEQRVAPVLVEVLTLLAERGATLPPGEAPPTTTLARDGAPRDGWSYVGTLRCRQALVMGERRFVGREGEHGRVRVPCAGLVDAYERGGYRASELELRVRGSAEDAVVRTERLVLPDPLLAVVDADAEHTIAPWARATVKHVAEHGLVAVLAFAPRYELSIHAPSADAPATRLVVRAV
jgi:hypothetical protein